MSETGPKLAPGADRDRNADKTYGVWDEVRREMISYRYFGSRSVLHDRYRATGTMPVRPDMRASGGMLLAPLAIGMLDAAGNAIDRLYQLGLTQVDIHAFGGALETTRVGFASDVNREARTQLFTEVVISDEASGRTIGHGSADWAIINPTPPGFEYNDPGEGFPYAPPMPPLTEIFEAKPRPEGGYQIDRLSLRIGLDTLHHGPILVVQEAAALDLANAAADGQTVMPVTLSCRIVRAGRVGPFIIVSELLGRNGDTISCRSTLRDQGRDDNIVAIMLWQGRIMAN